MVETPSRIARGRAYFKYVREKLEGRGGYRLEQVTLYIGLGYCAFGKVSCPRVTPYKAVPHNRVWGVP